MINGRVKGSVAEREFAGLVRDWSGVRLIRNLEQTRSGGFDLIVHPEETGPAADAFRTLAIECKRHQSASHSALQRWWEQAVLQAEDAELMPILAYRADRAPWRIVAPICLLNDQLSLCQNLNYTATLSIEGFCHAVLENVAHSAKQNKSDVIKLSSFIRSN
jgi:hypothetical protein